MPRLVPCPACRAHLMPAERSCPHCGAALSSMAATAGRGAIVLMGLALSACPNGGSNVPEPEYGVPDSSYRDDGGDLAEPEYGLPDTSPGDEPISMPEPDYGVPDSDPGDVAEPEYGVPDTGPLR